jgi:hypothetical protein
MTLTNPCHSNYELWRQSNYLNLKENAKHLWLSIIVKEFLLDIKLIEVKKPF